MSRMSERFDANSVAMLGFIQTCDLLGMNSCLSLLLNSGFTKRVHSHFDQLFVWTEKLNNGLFTNFSRLCGLRSSIHSSRLV